MPSILADLSALVYEPRCEGRGWVRGLSQWVLAVPVHNVHCIYCRAQINFGDLTSYLTYGFTLSPSFQRLSADIHRGQFWWFSNTASTALASSFLLGRSDPDSLLLLIQIQIQPGSGWLFFSKFVIENFKIKNSHKCFFKPPTKKGRSDSKKSL